MISTLSHFNKLTTFCKTNKSLNLLEGTLYLDEFYKFNELLNIIETNNIKYKIVSGFIGYSIADKSILFKSIILSSNNPNNIINLIDDNIFKFTLKDKKIKIQLRS